MPARRAAALGRDEMPLARLVPLGVAASSLVAAGLLAGEIVTRVADAVIPPGLG
jgi:hypothetical protein